MALVVLAALALGGLAAAERRRERFRRLADHHERQTRAWTIATGVPGPISPRAIARSNYHLRLWLKDERAAWRPWISVAPDTSPPE